MGKLRTALTGTLLSASLFASCTCHKQVEQPSILQEPKSGFQASGAQPKPRERAQAPTPTAPPKAAEEQVAQAPPSPTAAVQMPPDFPADVPVFKDASLAQVHDLANNARNVIFRTPAAVEDVAAFYQDTMTKGGWKITQQFTHGKHAFMTFQKSNMQASVTVAEDARNPGQQVIAIMYEQQQDIEEF